MGRSLYSPEGNLFLDLRLDVIHFEETIRSLATDEKQNCIERHHLETLLERIQISLLLGQADPDFPPHHPKDEFPDIYRKALSFWEKRFKFFLERGRDTHFHLM